MPGVGHMVLGASHLPARVPSCIVEDLIAAGRAGDGAIDTDKPPASLVGSTLAIASGPFADARGLCTMSTDRRVWLLLDVLGRSVEVTVAREQVVVA